MSYEATAWLLEAYPGRDGAAWLLLQLAFAADPDGYSALSVAVLAERSGQSEPTVRAQLLSLERRKQLRRCGEEEAPSWWLELRSDRRPRLYSLAAFLTWRAQAGDNPPVRSGDKQGTGSKRGKERGVNGVKTGSTLNPSDQPVSGVHFVQETRLVREGNSQVGEKGRAECPRCRGFGAVWNASGGFDQRCDCTEPGWEPPAPPVPPAERLEQLARMRAGQ